MRQEYKIARWFKIYAWIFLTVCMIAFAVLPVIPFFEYKFNLGHALFYIIPGVILEIFIIIGLIAIVKSKLIIEQYRIISIGVFNTKVLSLSDINGFRKNGHFLQFIPVNKQLDKINVSSFVENYNILVAWAQQNLKNFDLMDVEADENSILENSEFGLTCEERKSRLSRSKRHVRLLNTISWIIAFSVWFYPHFYKIQILICCTLPVIGLVLFKVSRGLILINERRNSVRPDVSSNIIIPSVVLLISALSDYNVIDYSFFIKPGMLIFTLSVFITVKVWNSHNTPVNFKSYLMLIPVLIISAIYTYGSIITTNAIFDKPDREVFNVKVLDKRISSGKGEAYYLMLESWGPQNEIKDVQVEKTFYENKKRGDFVIVHFKKGFYKIPYYMIVN